MDKSKPFVFSVLIKGEGTYKPSFHWKLNAGRIGKGQDSREIVATTTGATARPQTVSRDINPQYWHLINEFEKLTGVPLLLNTLFNVQEPIVLSPADAINTFSKASFDALVLENHLVVRNQGEPAKQA